MELICQVSERLLLEIKIIHSLNRTAAINSRNKIWTAGNKSNEKSLFKEAMHCPAKLDCLDTRNLAHALLTHVVLAVYTNQGLLRFFPQAYLPVVRGLSIIMV